MKQTKICASLSVMIGLSLFSLLLSAPTRYSWAEEPSKIRLAVAGFEKRGEELPVPDLELIVNEWLIAFLVNTHTFDVIERQALEQVLYEQSLGQSGILDSESAAKVGRLLGVDVLITGTLMYLGDTLEITARAIDTGNGSILGSASVSSDKEDDIRGSVERLADMLQTTLSSAVGDDAALLSEHFDDGHAWTERWSLDFDEKMKQAERDATKISQKDGVLQVQGNYRDSNKNRAFWLSPSSWQTFQSIEARFRFRDVQGGAVVCLDMTWGEDEHWTGLCPYREEDYGDLSLEVEGQEEPLTFEFDIRPDRWYVMRLEYKDGMFSYYWENQQIKQLAAEPAVGASDERSFGLVFMLEDTRSMLIEIDRLALW